MSSHCVSLQSSNILKIKTFFFPVQHPCEGNQQEVVAALTHTSIPTLPSPLLLLTLYITSSPHISLLHHLLLSFLMDKVLWLHSQTFGASDSVCVCACWLDCFYRQKGRMDEQSSPSQAKPCSHSVCVCVTVCVTVSCIFCAELRIWTFLFCRVPCCCVLIGHIFLPRRWFETDSSAQSLLIDPYRLINVAGSNFLSGCAV